VGIRNHPPLTAFVGRVELELFGTSLRGFRFFVALAEGFVVPFADLPPANSAASGRHNLRQLWQWPFRAPRCSGAHSCLTHLSITYGGYQWAYFVICLLKSEDPRWWIAIGGAIGVGMMTKYTMAFSGLGCGGGLASDAESAIPEEPWLWCGVVAASLIMLPNIVWQMQHQFVSE